MDLVPAAKLVPQNTADTRIASPSIQVYRLGGPVASDRADHEYFKFTFNKFLCSGLFKEC
jgi:hypothetical protein